MGTRAGRRLGLADVLSPEGLAQLTAAADGSHTQGGMIALMPTAEDAERLAIVGGEAADQLHCTLYFLGDDGAAWTEDQRNELEGLLRPLAELYELGPMRAKAFGAAHWNGGGDYPSWVWNVGDAELGEGVPLDGLLKVRACVTEALESTHERPELPPQHSPWSAHVCAAYSDDPALLAELEQRLGPVTFDRIRLSFGDDDRDILLGGEVTASAGVLTSRWDEDVVRVEVETNRGGSVLLNAMRTATEGFAAELGVPVHVTGRTRTTARTAAAGPLRRQPTKLETRSRVDFTAMDDAWQSAVEDTLAAWADIQKAQRKQITSAVKAAAEADDLDQLDTLTVDSSDGATLLYERMRTYAEQAGREQQREAEDQGVSVPPWSLDDEAVAAAAIGDRLRQVARTTARLLGVGLVQSGVRQAMRLFGSGTPAHVAGQVDAHLAGLSDAAQREAVGGAMSAAQNEGRTAVLSAAPPATYVATEALDRSSCKPCRDIDGTEYSDLTGARTAYPTGGYTGCLGGTRCRGFLIALWDEVPDEQAATGTILTASAATMPQQPTKQQEGTVPYSIVQDHPDCGAETPWAVVKEGEDAELMGCHATEQEAKDEQAALLAEEDDEKPEKPDDKAMDYAGKTAPWRGPLAIEGQVTGDGREFAADSLTWAELPVPLRWNKEDSHGGEARTIAVNVGRIDKVWRDGSLIMGEGVLDLSDEDGQRVHAKIEGKFLRGVSIDADSIADADVEFVWPDDANAGPGEGEEEDPFEMLFAQPEKVVFHGGRIRAATLVDIPAFAEAYIALLDEAGAVVAGGQPVGEAVVQEHDAQIAAEHAAPRALATVAASAELVKPPAAWFSDPKLSLPTPITVTDEGRIYGHAAQWGSCHIGQEGVCVQAPREDAHPYYRTGEVACEDGSRVAVGQITVGTGHAPLNLGASPAAEHYDNTGSAVADVAVGNDEHGIWVAGSVRPGADPLRVYELQAAGQVSGDWRRIGGELRLVGLLAVNVPGFPVPKMRARVASGAPQALVAAGRPTVAHVRPQEDADADAVRRVMRMLSRRVHPGGR